MQPGGAAGPRRRSHHVGNDQCHPLTVETAALETVEVDIYRDIHKGIRTEMFAVTAQAGSTDSGDDGAIAAVRDRFHGLVELLISHAEHEDEFLQPLAEVHAPELAALIARQHQEIEARMAQLEVLAEQAVAVAAATSGRRLAVHRLYLAFANFTASYLEHQEVEELRVMPALSSAIGAAELAEVHRAVVASIPLDEMATALALMLPAMNLEDRVQLLGGMQAGAPAEVFTGVVGLARSVLAAGDYAALAGRLGL